MLKLAGPGGHLDSGTENANPPPPLFGNERLRLKAAKATDRFGGEINAVLNLGRIIWGLTSGRFALRRSGRILTLRLLTHVEWNFAGCDM